MPATQETGRHTGMKDKDYDLIWFTDQANTTPENR